MDCPFCASVVWSHRDTCRPDPDDIVDMWHDNHWPDYSLEYVMDKIMGWTPAQYRTWVMDPAKMGF